MKKLFAFLLFISVATQAQETTRKDQEDQSKRTSIESETSVAPQTFMEYLAGSGYLSHSATAWNVTYTYTKSNSTDPNGIDISNITHQITAGLDWELSQAAHLSGDLLFATTPSENLRNLGPKLGFSYRFNSWLTSKTEGNYQSYQQTLGAGRRFIPGRPASGQNVITQLQLTETLTFTPLESLDIKLSYSSYSYSRDINAFVGLLDSPQGLQVGGGGLASAMAGFSSQSMSLELDWSINDQWDATLEETLYQAAAGGTWTVASKVMLGREFSDAFRMELGGERDVASGSADNLLLVDLKFSY